MKNIHLVLKIINTFQWSSVQSIWAWMKDQTSLETVQEMNDRSIVHRPDTWNGVGCSLDTLHKRTASPWGGTRNHRHGCFVASNLLESNTDI